MRVLNSNFYTAYAKRNMGATRNRNVPCSTKDFNLTNLPNYKACFFLHLNSHNTAFGGALSLKKQIDRLKPNQLPSQEILKKATTAIANPKNKQTLFHIHNEVYFPLSNCKTLYEAKILYPEFKDVIDANNIDIAPHERTMQKIARGEIEGLTTENLTMTFLKKFYVEIAKLTDKDKWFQLSSEAIINIAKRLNIQRLDSQYISIYKTSNPVTKSNMSKARNEYLKQNPGDMDKLTKASKEYFADDTKRQAFRDERKKYYETHPDEKNAIIERLQGFLKEHPEVIQERSESIRNYWQDPNKRAEQSQKLTAYWQDPDARQEQTEKMLRFHKENPEFAKLMSEAWHNYQYVIDIMKIVAETEFPGIGKIFSKRKNKIALSDSETAYMLKYYKKCQMLCPEGKKQIGQDFSKMWQDFKNNN